MKMKKIFLVLTIIMLINCSVPVEYYTNIQPEKIVPINLLYPSGSINDFDGLYVFDPEIVYHDNQYFLYYTGGTIQEIAGRETVGVATSTDGINFIKQKQDGFMGSLFQLGKIGSFNYDRNWGQGTSIYDNNEFKIWFIGDRDPSAEHIGSIGYATSNDGLNFNLYPGQYQGAILQNYDVTYRGIKDTAIIKDNGIYYLWCSFFYKYGNPVYRSIDGITWESISIKDGFKIIKYAQFNYYHDSLGNIIKYHDKYILTSQWGGEILLFVSTDKFNWILNNRFSANDYYLFAASLYQDEITSKFKLFYTTSDSKNFNEKMGNTVIAYSNIDLNF
jgi:hypothetical protein